MYTTRHEQEPMQDHGHIWFLYVSTGKRIAIINDIEDWPLLQRTQPTPHTPHFSILNELVVLMGPRGLKPLSSHGFRQKRTILWDKHALRHMLPSPQACARALYRVVQSSSIQFESGARLECTPRSSMWNENAQASCDVASFRARGSNRSQAWVPYRIMGV